MINFAEIIKGDVQRMSSIERYSSYPVVRRENVAEHSWYVCFYALLIADDLGLDEEARYKVLRKAIIHDVDECLMGDVVITTKYEVPGLAAALEGASLDRLRVLFKQIGDCDYSQDWKGCKTEGLSGLIIQLCDYLSVLSYMTQEYYLGNRKAEIIIKQCIERSSKWVSRLPDPFRRMLHSYLQSAITAVEEALCLYQ